MIISLRKVCPFHVKANQDPVEVTAKLVHAEECSGRVPVDHLPQPVHSPSQFVDRSFARVQSLLARCTWWPNGHHGVAVSARSCLQLS